LDLLQAGDAEPSVGTADLLAQYGLFYLSGKNNLTAAESMFKQALSIYRSLPDQNLSIAATLSELASTASWAGKYEQAEDYQRQALNIFRATTSSKYPDHNVALATLGHILTRRGKYAEAEQSLNEALQVETTVFGADNLRSAAIESHLSELYSLEGDKARALQAGKEALRIALLRLGDKHATTGYYYDGLANLYLQAGNLSEAEANERRALAVYAVALPARHLYVASGQQLLGEVHLRRGAFVEAERELRSAYDLEISLSAADWQIARTNASLAWLAISRDDAAEGEPRLTEALAKLQAQLGPRDPETVLTTTRLAQYLSSHHREAEAEKLLRATQ
jgi:tetratricopeptide (TPR) repeat protein